MLRPTAVAPTCWALLVRYGVWAKKHRGQQRRCSGTATARRRKTTHHRGIGPRTRHGDAEAMQAPAPCFHQCAVPDGMLGLDEIFTAAQSAPGRQGRQVNRPVSPRAPSATAARTADQLAPASVIALTRPAPVDVRSSRRHAQTRWPSRQRTSHSAVGASLGASRAANVCSGRVAEAPRWATTNGCRETTSPASRRHLPPVPHPPTQLREPIRRAGSIVGPHPAMGGPSTGLLKSSRPRSRTAAANASRWWATIMATVLLAMPWASCAPLVTLRRPKSRR